MGHERLSLAVGAQSHGGFSPASVCRAAHSADTKKCVCLPNTRPVNMSLASRNVAWDAMRNSSSFRVKSLSGTRAVLSREAGSLSNTHSMSSSGLVNDKAISIQPAAAKEGAFFPVSMRVKTAKNAQKPKSGAATISLSRGGFNRALVNIKRASGDRFYRKDLERAALARYSAIVRSQTPARNDKVAGKGRGRRNRNRA